MFWSNAKTFKYRTFLFALLVTLVFLSFPHFVWLFLQAVRNGSVFQGTPLIMKWYTPKPPPPPPAPPSPSSTSPVSAVPFEENGQLVKERPKLVLNLEATQQVSGHKMQLPLPPSGSAVLFPSMFPVFITTQNVSPVVMHW